MNGGLLITFSGLDGAGKSTQLGLLCEYFRSQGLRPMRIWTRGGYTGLFEAMKRLIRSLTRGRLPPSGDSERRACMLREPWLCKLWLFMALLDLLRIYGVQVRLWQILGRPVLCDRYVWDSWLDLAINFPDDRVTEMAAVAMAGKSLAPSGPSIRVFDLCRRVRQALGDQGGSPSGILRTSSRRGLNSIKVWPRRTDGTNWMGLRRPKRCLRWVWPQVKRRTSCLPIPTSLSFLRDIKENGQPVSIIEAVSHGIPIISTRYRGIPGLVQSGDNGLLLDEETTEAIADAVQTIALDIETYTRMRSRALEIVNERYTKEKRLNELIPAILGGARSPDVNPVPSASAPPASA
ncbi:glycosyltransferase [Nitrospiraceae bacterium AH_259_D15_M11_P09]|nr:glycosyltransferase [Nitrospiraceae bacterium AH_259_D15_M11_P09]